jgi:hypothetical protein
MSATIELDKEQCRVVCFQHLIDTMVTMKQYMSESDLQHYKFMLKEMGNLMELGPAVKRFNQAWPSDLLWGDC